MGFGYSYLACIHTLTMLLGLTICGIGIYLLIAGNTIFPQDFVYAEWQVWLGIGVGAGIFLISLAGCLCITVLQCKAVIFLFALFQFALGITIIVAGSTMVIVAGDYINAIVSADQATQGLAAGIGGLQIQLSDFLLGMFVGCCNSTIVLSPCPTVFVTEGKQYCYENGATYDVGLETGDAAISNYCTLVDIPEACPADIPSFLSANQLVLSTYIWPAGIAFIVSGSLLFIASFFTYHLSCRPSRQEIERERYYQERAYGVPHRGDYQIRLS